MMFVCARLELVNMETQYCLGFLDFCMFAVTETIHADLIMIVDYLLYRSYWPCTLYVSYYIEYTG